jgi:hypothetical protein
MSDNSGNNTQTGDPIWAGGFYGMDSEIMSWEGFINEGGTLNIPWLVGLMSSTGNGMTASIGSSAVIFSDPEWADGSGGGSGMRGGQEGEASSGGLIVSW